MKSKYVSVWDDGIVIETECVYDSTTNDVIEVESVEVNDLDILIEEYVVTPDGDVVYDFTLYGEER